MRISELKKLSQVMADKQNELQQMDTQEVFQIMGMDPSSFYQELQMESDYVDTHQDISYSNHHLQFHSHSFFELLCCRNTCNAEYLVGSERYKLQKGDIIIIPPGFSHRPLLPEVLSEPYIRDVLWISEEFWKFLIKSTPELQDHCFTKPFFFRTAGTGWEFICDLIRDGVKESDSNSLGWNSLIIANTVNIMIQLIRAKLDKPNNPMKAEKPELLDQVLSYVEEHLSEKISLPEIARQFYVSESTITQTFRKKIGISFYRCVTQRRLIAAKRLIENGVSLESTAEQVGFTDYSSFFRAFKQEYGIAPRQYRKMNGN